MIFHGLNDVLLSARGEGVENYSEEDEDEEKEDAKEHILPTQSIQINIDLPDKARLKAHFTSLIFYKNIKTKYGDFRFFESSLLSRLNLAHFIFTGLSNQTIVLKTKNIISFLSDLKGETGSVAY